MLTGLNWVLQERLDYNPVMLRLLFAVVCAFAFSVVFAQDWATFGDWSLVVGTDAATGQDTSSLITTAIEFPSFDGPVAPSLVIRCTDSASSMYGIELFLYAGRHLSDDHFALVAYSVPGGPQPEPKPLWNQDATHRAVFIDREEILAFLQDITGAPEVELLVAPLAPEPELLRYTVPVRGLSQALYSLRCYSGPQV